MAVDFKQIRSTPKSKNDSFETLSVQLFQRSCDVHNQATFISLRGDGGDGGVEAFFRNHNNNIIGIQAKYFFQLSTSELNQIKGSLETALINHPTLIEYWIYIPFDLTGRVAAGKRGKSEAERFEEWKNDVENQAILKGKNLIIKLCTATSILSQLLEIDTNGGMRKYWFDDTILKKSHIQYCLNEAIAFAGPRYLADLDVVTNVHDGLDFFGGIGNFFAWKEGTLAPIVSSIRDLKGWGKESLEIFSKENGVLILNLIDEVIIGCESITDITLCKKTVEEIISNIRDLLEHLISVRQEQEKQFFEQYGTNSDTPNFRQFQAEYLCVFPAGNMDAAREWEKNFLQLNEALLCQEIGASTTGSLLLIGPAGIGKTHSIVNAAIRRFEKGGFSLVVFGDDFGVIEPWEVIRSKLGFGSNLTRAELFECLNSCAEHTGLPFVIYIDALNESPKSAKWKKKLPELLTQCKAYPAIKVCISTRDTYKDLVVDSRFPGFAFEHTGFKGQEVEAVEAFATYYGLDAEITPVFSLELSNPLFLHLACKTLKKEGSNVLDISLSGFSSLLETHLKHCDELIRERLDYSNPRNIVRAAMMELAEILTQYLPEDRTWENCTTNLLKVVGNELSPESLLNELQHEGLIILTAGKNDSWLVRLGYQRYGDTLRAIKLVDSIVKNTTVDLSELATRINTIIFEEDGVLEALAAVLPEKLGIEITSSHLELDPEKANKLFVNSLLWRSKESIPCDIHNHLFNALSTPNLWLTVYDTFFRLSLVPNHGLNAENWLDFFLNRSSMVDRDAFLSPAVFKSFDQKNGVWFLINAVLKANIQKWPEESRKLATIALAWLSSAADRRIRDLASKGLTKLFMLYPYLGRELAITFINCDDDYIVESITLSIYSACLLNKKNRKDYIPCIEVLINIASDNSNVLIRDHISLLSLLMSCENLPDKIVNKLKNFPKKSSPPSRWPKINDVKPLLDLKDLPINMNLWGKGIDPDFFSYQIESKIRKFDLNSSGISLENIACWIMQQVLEIGYPGYQETALNADQVLVHEFGSGRGRKVYGERLGKKYYWILFHRLIGILADNVPLKGSKQVEFNCLWSLDVRKSDLTDIRDISDPISYPDQLLNGKKYNFPERNEIIEDWICKDDFTSHCQSLIHTLDEVEWVALDIHVHEDDLGPDEKGWQSPYLGLDFCYRGALFDNNHASKLTEDMLEKFNIYNSSSYQAYLAEYPDSLVFKELLNCENEKFELTQFNLMRGGEWEYDCSYQSLERPSNINVPCRSIVMNLNLVWDKQRGWNTLDGELSIFEAILGNRKGLFIRRKDLNKYLNLTKKRLIYHRFVRRSYIDIYGDNTIQKEIDTWLEYLIGMEPVILDEKTSNFKCKNKFEKDGGNLFFPFATKDS